MAEPRVRFPRNAYVRRCESLGREMALWADRRFEESQSDSIAFNRVVLEQNALDRHEILKEVHDLLINAAFKLAMMP